MCKTNNRHICNVAVILQTLLGIYFSNTNICVAHTTSIIHRSAISTLYVCTYVFECIHVHTSICIYLPMYQRITLVDILVIVELIHCS